MPGCASGRPRRRSCGGRCARFWPGERVEDALAAARELQRQGITTILTALGENLTHAEEAEEVTQHYLEVFDKVAAVGPRRARLGQADAARARSRPRRCASATSIACSSAPSSATTSCGSTWSIRRYVDPTLELFRRSRAKSARIGIALQAYLYRTAKDVESLLPLGPAVRIVKGAYLEPPDVAYPKKSDVDENFYKLCVRLMSPEAQRAGALLHIATHDVALADRLDAYAREHNVPASAYEFAMLYGIGVGQQQRLAAEGKRLRVLISYGEYWFPWYMRRLAERPANVWFVVKNMFG